jgi:peroxiredoxin
LQKPGSTVSADEHAQTFMRMWFGHIAVSGAMNMRRVLAVSLCSILAVGLAAAASARPGPDDTIRLRGGGKTRDTLNAMHLKPFDQGLWGSLSDFSGGDPVSAEATQGKVVLVVTWASWLRTSHPAMRAAQEAFAKFKDQGLVVVGVHHPTQSETAPESAKSLGATFPVAADKNGKFRSALNAEQDPNIYFIDRAGNIRFAQAEVGSLMDAAALLIAETPETAKDLPTRLAADAKAAERDRWKTRDLSNDVLNTGPEVQFTEPDEEAYTKAKWPYLFGKIERDKILERIKNDAPKIANWPDEDWVPAAPAGKGKIKVVYLFDPQDPPMLNIIPLMNRVADKYKKDAVIVGTMFKSGAGGIGQQNSGGGDDEAKIKERNKEYLSKLIVGRTINHPLNPTMLKADNLELSDGSLLPRISRSNAEFGIAVILSTDMRIRWMGDPATSDLGVAIEKIADADPGVQARRKAEAKAKGK